MVKLGEMGGYVGSASVCYSISLGSNLDIPQRATSVKEWPKHSSPNLTYIQPHLHTSMSVSTLFPYFLVTPTYILLLHMATPNFHHLAMSSFSYVMRQLVTISYSLASTCGSTLYVYKPQRLRLHYPVYCTTSTRTLTTAHFVTTSNRTVHVMSIHVALLLLANKKFSRACNVINI